MSENQEAGPDAGNMARRVLNQHFFGVLSTLSVKFTGHPFGSVVPFCLDYTGKPLLLISRLAQHTHNIQSDPRVSLLILDRPADNEGNVQTDARLTLVGQACKVADPDVEASAARYYRHFPEAKGYHTELDFEFYTLSIETLRFISGFGQARWLSAGQVVLPNPFTLEEEARIVGHMNEDHRDALLHYHQSAPIQGNETSEINPDLVEMVAIDAEGIVLRVNEGLERILFSRRIQTTAEARQILVEMAQA